MAMTFRAKLELLKWLSIGLFLSGLVIIISSIVVGVNSEGWGYDDALTPKEFMATRNVGLALLWICAFLAIGNAVIALCFIKFEKRCLVMFFGSSLGVISIICLAVGSVFAFQSGYFPSAVEVMCTPKNTPQQQPFMKRSYLDTNMLLQVNLNMCTQNCPCDETAYSQGYADVDEADFNYHGRTKSGSDGKLGITTQPSGGYMTFEQCWNASQRAKTSNETLIKSMDTYMKVMKLLEVRLDCSGACIPSLFWFTRPVSSVPKKGCLLLVADEVANTYLIPGWACIGSSIVCFLIFLFQYTLWCRDKNSGEATGDCQTKPVEHVDDE